MHYYRAFGLTIESEIELPKLLIQEQSDTTDIHIVYGSVRIPDSTDDGHAQHCQLDNGDLLLDITDVARFRISKNTIIIDVESSADMQTVRLYLLGSGLGALMLQRGNLLLHGNAININGKAVIVVAKSGVGKSTLAGEFFNRGYSLLADDVCCVDKNGLIQPSYPYLKIWNDSIKNLKLKDQNIERIREQDDKYYYPVRELFQKNALPVSSIYILNKVNIAELETFNVVGFKKVQRLKNHLYRPLYSKVLGINQQLILQLSKIAQAVPVSYIARPTNHFSASQITDLILKAETNKHEKL